MVFPAPSKSPGLPSAASRRSVETAPSNDPGDAKTGTTKRCSRGTTTESSVPPPLLESAVPPCGGGPATPPSACASWYGAFMSATSGRRVSTESTKTRTMSNATSGWFIGTMCPASATTSSASGPCSWTYPAARGGLRAVLLPRRLRRAPSSPPLVGSSRPPSRSHGTYGASRKPPWPGQSRRWSDRWTPTWLQMRSNWPL
mmetsp:Transcript_4827/g.19700  ORF Transcript_4827/g.19700 Transcript_4827/m.19700 type:complete len:201 (-) Transcript_4827:1286-1888(-)